MCHRLLILGALLWVGAAAAAAERPLLCNPYNGMQHREERFEFARPPAVRRQGDGYVITFASKGRCDATVAVLSKEGRIVRHLASGVLGRNAPHPFRQGTLDQRIEWDGRDDSGRPVPAGCSIRVGLGLAAEFERNIGYDPHALPSGTGGSQLPEVRRNAANQFLVAGGPGGRTYVLGLPQRAGYQGRVFKDGKYVRTFWPVPAGDVAKLTGLGYRLAKTVWGDASIVCGWFGPTRLQKDARKLQLAEIGKAMFQAAGIAEYQVKPRPAGIPASKLPPLFDVFYDAKQLRMAVDRRREQLYIYPGRGLTRLDGRTGRVDDTWFPDGGLDRISECCVGPDGLVYISTGPHWYGQFVTKLDHEGRPVPFGGDAVPLPRGNKWQGGGGQYGPMEGKGIYGSSVCPTALREYKQEIRSLWTGHFGHSNTHERGLYVSATGHILAAVQYPWTGRAIRHGVPADAPRRDEDRVATSYVAVWDRDGNLLTANAVGDMQNGHGVAMDRDGNIYAAMGGRIPAGQRAMDGIVGEKLSMFTWGSYGSLLKFRGGVPFPRGKAHYGKDPPAAAARLDGYRRGLTAIEGALWIYGGLPCQRPDICTCHNLRYDMDGFARHWLPANHLHSVIVLDANGNRIARIGRYGNVDDADERCGRIHFVWPRALAVSDAALYVADTGNRRILKAALRYRATRSVDLPADASAE
jgi:hypothetical protein